MDSVSKKIEEIFDLFNSGAITEEEFKLLKRGIIEESVKNDQEKTKYSVHKNEQDTYQKTKEDIDSLILSAINLTTEKDFLKAKEVFLRNLKFDSTNDLINNRGQLYYVRCLLHESISPHLFTILKQINLKQIKLQEHPDDEILLLEILDYIIVKWKPLFKSKNNYNTLSVIQEIGSNIFNQNNPNLSEKTGELYVFIGDLLYKEKFYNDSLNYFIVAYKKNPSRKDFEKILNIKQKEVYRKKAKRTLIKSILIVFIAVLYFASAVYYKNYYKRNKETAQNSARNDTTVIEENYNNSKKIVERSNNNLSILDQRRKQAEIDIAKELENDNSLSWFEKLGKFEDLILPYYTDLVKRKFNYSEDYPSVLELELNSKDVITLKDSGTLDPIKGFFFRSYDTEINYYLLEWFDWSGEISGKLLINRSTGEKIYLSNSIEFSPNKKYLVSSSEFDGISDGDLSVFKLNGDNLPLLELKENGSYSDVIWVSELSFTAHLRENGADYNTYIEYLFLNIKDKWTKTRKQ